MANITLRGAQITVDLTQVANGRTIVVTFGGVRLLAGSTTYTVSIPMGVLVGDTTGNGVVDSSDVIQTRSNSGSLVTQSNFRNDVNLDGIVDSSDVGIVQSNSGTVLH